MADGIPEGDETPRFPYSNPLFADATPDEIVQWTWVLETMELDNDRALLNKLGIEGKVRDELQSRMVLGRLTFKSMVSHGVGFEDPNGTKIPKMMQFASRLVYEARINEPDSGSTPPA
jgi:hypothetical protein